MWDHLQYFNYRTIGMFEYKFKITERICHRNTRSTIHNTQLHTIYIYICTWHRNGEMEQNTDAFLKSIQCAMYFVMG